MRLYSHGLARTPDGNSYRVGSIQLSASNADDLDAIQARVEALLRERHDLGADGSKDDFRIADHAQLGAAGVGFSTAVGLFFGIYPAQRAAGLNPIKALRHE